MSALTDAIAAAETQLGLSQTVLVQAQQAATNLGASLVALKQQLAAIKALASETDAGTPGVTDTGVPVVTS